MIIYPNSRRIATNQGSLNFNGASNNGNGLSVANSLAQFGVNPQTMTVAAWMFLPFGTLSSSGPYSWFDCSSSSTSGVRLDVYINGPSEVTIYCDSNYTAGPTLSVGWNFVAYTGNGSSFSYYVRSPTGVFSTVTGTNTINTGSGNTLVVGNSISTNNATAIVWLSDLRIYNYPKTKIELMKESMQRQPVSLRGLKSYLPLRNVGSMQNDVFNNIQWTLNGTRSNFLNSLQGPPAPEVATVRRARFLSHAAASQSHLYMTMGVGS
jgi:hypothetical protein